MESKDPEPVFWIYTLDICISDLGRGLSKRNTNSPVLKTRALVGYFSDILDSALWGMHWGIRNSFR